MKRCAIPLTGLLCLALWACAQPVPAPPAPVAPAPPVTTRLTSVMCPDGSDLLDHVHYVQLSVQLSPQAGSVQPNTDFTVTADSTPIDQAIKSDLAAAFKANPNPAFAKNELCPPFTTSGGITNPGLDGIFINRAQCVNPSNPNDYDPSNCSGMTDTDVAANSWGLRTPLPTSKKYIAISLGLWRCSSGRGYCAPSFTQFHQRLNKALLDTTCKTQNPQCNAANIPPPNFQIPAGGPPNAPDLSILAALAHERGHIYWFETFVQRPGDAPTNLVTLAGGFCGGRIYPRGQWRGVAVGLPDHRYVQFAALNRNSSVAVANLPTLLNSVDPTDATVAAGIIDAIYVGGQYPSLLAAYSPDEEFVEAFEWSVLRNAGLGELTVDGHAILHGGQAGMGAEAKLECFDALSH